MRPGRPELRTAVRRVGILPPAAVASVHAALAGHDPDTVLVVCDYGAGLLDRAADVLTGSALIESLGFVDHVIVFSEDRPVALLAELRPEIYAKGGDYTPEMLEETDVVRSYGGEVRILDYLPAHSTTHIVDRIVTGSIPR